MVATEAAARIRINKLLEASGWRFVDEPAGRANIELEPGADISKVGDDFEHTTKGYIDYLLLDDRGFPVAVLEAKREKIHPLAAKEQARDYAKGKNTRCSPSATFAHSSERFEDKIQATIDRVWGTEASEPPIVGSHEPGEEAV